jgi:HlyD family secretion protein
MQRLTAELATKPAPPATRRRFRLPRAVSIALAIVALLVLAIGGWQLRPKPTAPAYRMGSVERGSITKAVSASGTLQALITVDVGSQISGQISDVKVDFNDKVRKGQVMAIIDPQTFQSRVAQEEADVNAAEAATRQAEAQAANAKADYGRKSELVAKGVYSPSVLDLAKATWLNADAAVAAAKARVGQTHALLNANRVDLRRTVIVAPIDGVVVDRKINPGQTVAASFQAPVLFTLAQDLSKLQVKISVDEADVGQVREGQKVRFSVDAFPDESFQGVVTQVRKQPTTEQNVVAYTVIAVADNPDLKLLPGMTANADIVIDVHPNVLKVPAAALRWKPPVQAPRPGRNGPMLGAPPPGMGGRQIAQSQPKGSRRTGAVYVLRDGKPVAVPVGVGASDGTNTEVSGPLNVGDKVIIGGGPKGPGASGAQIRIGG